MPASKQPRKHVIDKYSAIAKEYVANNFANLKAIYSKYYPNCKESTLDTNPYRMLRSERFRICLYEALNDVDIDKLDLRKEVIKTLTDEMLSAQTSNDRRSAAYVLGKALSMFTDNLNIENNLIVKQEDKDSLKSVEEIVFKGTTPQKEGVLAKKTISQGKG